jgi:hypothetical protein
MELPIRILSPGVNIEMEVTRYEIRGHKLSNTSIQAVCSKLINHQDVAAIRNSLTKEQEIIVCAKDVIKNYTISVDIPNSNETWKVTLEKIDKVALSFRNQSHRVLIADLYQRRLEKNISNSLFYEEKPFHVSNEFEAYRSFKISRNIIDDAGIGFSLAIGTIFLTEPSAADFYKSGRIADLDLLLQRSNELKGTMLFFGPNIVNKVYYSRFCSEYKCGTVPQFSVKGKDFANLVHYYSEHSQYGIQTDDLVAYVSFQNLGSPRPVPAKKLKARIFNDALPGEMKRLDKISPEQRRKLTIGFWNSVGSNVLRAPFEGLLQDYFFRPSAEKYGVINMPNLKFGMNRHGFNQILPKPDSRSVEAYQANFRDRKRYLDSYGCFKVPPTIEQEIYFPFPKTVPADAQNLFAESLSNKVSTLVGIEITHHIHPYDHYIQAAYKLKEEKDTGMAVFVFDDTKPATYYGISRELSDWSIKRVTSRELRKKFTARQKAKKWREANSINSPSKEERDWDSFIDLCAYDTVQQLGCVPWTIDGSLNYDMHLAIDVSEDYTHFALSLMVFNTELGYPIFKTETERKLDQYMETINSEDLKEELRNLFHDPLLQQLKNQGKLGSLLIYRDGKDCDGEFSALAELIPELQRAGKLPENLRFDFVLVRKHLSNGIRGWVNNTDAITNVMEGTYWFKTKTTGLLWTTGCSTISTKATAEPIEVEMRYTEGNLLAILEDLMHAAQFNYSSPSKAQKLSSPLKRSDEKLREKRAEELKLK